jgi:hypothetical protein
VEVEINEFNPMNTNSKADEKDLSLQDGSFLLDCDNHLKVFPVVVSIPRKPTPSQLSRSTPSFVKELENMVPSLRISKKKKAQQTAAEVEELDLDTKTHKK